MKLSVCVDALFMGKDFAESVKKVHETGIKAFEFWTWWDKDLKEVKRLKDETGMEISLFCTKFVSLVDKGQRKSYIEGLKQSIEAANELGCKTLVSQTGNDNGYPKDYQMKVMAEGLAECAPLLKEAGVILAVEPLNQHIDHAGHFLASSLDGFSLVETVGSPNVKILYDIYHQQITEGNITNTILANIDKIGHFHAAGLPGRSELYNSELDYGYIFKRIDETGYNGFVGLEYFPKDDPIEGIRKAMELSR